MVWVKICGITNEADLELCVAAGVDAVGLVAEYYLPVPWNLDRAAVLDLIKRTPPPVQTVVVAGGPPAQVIAIAQFTHPDILQLHGRESLAEIAIVTREAHRLGIRVFKALGINPETGQALFEIPEPWDAAQALEQAGLDGLVIDTRTATSPAGTGITLDWEKVGEWRRRLALPVILAGGLTPANVAAAVNTVAPFGVDVISGVEQTRGRKDPLKVREFVRRAQGVALGGGSSTGHLGEVLERKI